MTTTTVKIYAQLTARHGHRDELVSAIVGSIEDALADLASMWEGDNEDEAVEIFWVDDGSSEAPVTIDPDGTVRYLDGHLTAHISNFA